MSEKFEVIVICGGILSLLTAWGFRLYIRHGRYQKVPVVDCNSNGWFEVPFWLRLPVLVSLGFFIASVLEYAVCAFLGNRLSMWMSGVTETLSLVLALVMVMAELGPTKISSNTRRRIVYSAAIVLGMALAMLIYNEVFSLVS